MVDFYEFVLCEGYGEIVMYTLNLTGVKMQGICLNVVEPDSRFEPVLNWILESDCGKPAIEVLRAIVEFEMAKYDPYGFFSMNAVMLPRYHAIVPAATKALEAIGIEVL